MSIYPKTLKLGESVNIHLGIKGGNLPKKKMNCQVILDITSPQSRTKFEKHIILGNNSLEHHYFKFKTFDVGLHKLTAYIILDGIEIFSSTQDNDYFKVNPNDKQAIDLKDYLLFLDPLEDSRLLLKDALTICNNHNSCIKTEIARKFKAHLSSKDLKENSFNNIFKII